MKKILLQLIILIVCFGLVTPVFASDTAILDVDLIIDITSQEPTQDTPELPPEEPQPQEEQLEPPPEEPELQQEPPQEEEILASPSGGPSDGSMEEETLIEPAEEDITDTSVYELLDFNNHNPGLTSFISDAVSDLFNNLKKLGVTIKDGVIKAIKLVVDEVKTRILRIKVVKDRDNVIGTAVFPPLANEAVIVNSLVEKGCKIFISFRSDTGNRTWHISKKIPGYGFKIRLSEITPKPLEFDYWIVLIEGQEPTDTGYQQALTPEPELPTEVGTPTESVGAEIADCIDPEATNYNPEATIDDGSCEYATQRFYLDADSDGYGDPENFIDAYEIPEGYTADNNDCDDSDFDINPGVADICWDNIDNNCDGQIDENCSYGTNTCEIIKNLIGECLNSADDPNCEPVCFCADGFNDCNDDSSDGCETEGECSL